MDALQQRVEKLLKILFPLLWFILIIMVLFNINGDNPFYAGLGVFILGLTLGNIIGLWVIKEEIAYRKLKHGTA